MKKKAIIILLFAAGLLVLVVLWSLGNNKETLPDGYVSNDILREYISNKTGRAPEKIHIFTVNKKRTLVLGDTVSDADTYIEGERINTK